MSGRIFCIGRNYADHATELGNEIPTEPVVFMKSSDCALGDGEPIPFPQHGEDLQHEAEMVLRIGAPLSADDDDAALAAVDGVTLGLDLTLRDVQLKLKSAGLPWEKAKAFPGSATIGNFVSPDVVGPLDEQHFMCQVNGIMTQVGDTARMLFNCASLLRHINRIWPLRAGDLVFTGTPEGVGPLRPGDTVSLSSRVLGPFSWTVSGT